MVRQIKVLARYWAGKSLGDKCPSTEKEHRLHTVFATDWPALLLAAGLELNSYLLFATLERRGREVKAGRQISPHGYSPPRPAFEKLRVLSKRVT